MTECTDEILSSGSYFIGVNYGVYEGSSNPIAVSPDREYVSGEGNPVASVKPEQLHDAIDGVVRRFGWEAYDSLLTDPVASAAFELLKLGVVTAKMDLLARKSEDAPGFDEAKAEKIASFCRRLINTQDTAWIVFLWEALDALAYGNKLAEKTYKIKEYGQDEGLYVFQSLKFKPRKSWSFLVDDKFNVLGIVAWTSDSGNPKLLPRSKFAIFTWDARNGDPRGRSVLRPAFEAWKNKVETWPEYEKFRRRFAQPVPIGKTAPGAQPGPPLDTLGKPIPGARPISAQELLAGTLDHWKSGVTIAVPFGTEIELLESRTEGAVFLEAVNLFNHEIVHAILKTTRSTLEAAHGSKADSETSDDNTNRVQKLPRVVAAEFIHRELLRDAVEINFGAEAAELYTPYPEFSDIEKQDFAIVAQAVAALTRAKYLSKEQLQAMDAMLGIHVRNDPDGDLAGAPEKPVAKPNGGTKTDARP